MGTQLELAGCEAEEATFNPHEWTARGAWRAKRAAVYANTAGNIPQDGLAVKRFRELAVREIDIAMSLLRRAREGLVK